MNIVAKQTTEAVKIKGCDCIENSREIETFTGGCVLMNMMGSWLLRVGGRDLNLSDGRYVVRVNDKIKVVSAKSARNMGLLA